MNTLSLNIRKMAYDLGQKAEIAHWGDLIKKTYGLSIYIESGIQDGYWIVRQIYNILKQAPSELVRACGVTKLYIKYLGKNREKYPNHGYYQESDHSVTLNSDIFIHPDQPEDFFDSRRNYLTRCEQTLYHEFSHALDAKLGNISLKPAWMSLSGWSKDYKPGLKQLIIREKGSPEVMGEYFYDPIHEKEFTRFYAKRNPWDDLADSMGFWMANMKEKIPPTKKSYLDNLLKKFH